jgi:hypothetical protein
MERDPGASLRKIARSVGLSVATVRDVRQRLQRGEDPVPGRFGNGSPAGAAAARPRDQADTPRDRDLLLGKLRRDPALRLSESGRTLLGWLATRTAGPAGWEAVLGAVPPHSAALVAELLRGCAEEWLTVADRLIDRTGGTPVEEGREEEAEDDRGGVQLSARVS